MQFVVALGRRACRSFGEGEHIHLLPLFCGDHGKAHTWGMCSIDQSSRAYSASLDIWLEMAGGREKTDRGRSKGSGGKSTKWRTQICLSGASSSSARTRENLTQKCGIGGQRGSRNAVGPVPALWECASVFAVPTSLQWRGSGRACPVRFEQREGSPIQHRYSTQQAGAPPCYVLNPVNPFCYKTLALPEFSIVS
jgi:hypothetical protein